MCRALRLDDGLDGPCPRGSNQNNTKRSAVVNARNWWTVLGTIVYIVEAKLRVATTGGLRHSNLAR